MKDVTELATDGSAGQSISFNRENYNRTVVRTSGKNDTFGDDDILTTYQFDNYGRTICSESKTADNVRYGGEILSYTAGSVNSSGSNIKKLNRVADEDYSEKYVRKRVY